MFDRRHLRRDDALERTAFQLEELTKATLWNRRESYTCGRPLTSCAVLGRFADGSPRDGGGPRAVRVRFAGRLAGADYR
jgi:hypothetical protein